MTQLGMPFADAARAFGWGNLADFANNLPQQSATWRALYADESRFTTPLQQMATMADLYDAIAALTHLVAKAFGAKGRAPEPYPRPWKKGGGNSLGSDPIPISEYDEWYYGGD